jgi:hypothetical protein
MCLVDGKKLCFFGVIIWNPAEFHPHLVFSKQKTAVDAAV